MVVRPFILNHVLTDGDVQLTEAHVVEVHIGGLQPVDERKSRRLVAVPGIVGPVSPAAGLVLVHVSHVRIHQRKRVGEPVGAVFANDAQQPHAATELDGPGTGASPVAQHLFRITLL